MNSLNFNIDHGYLEGLLRGFKGGILKQSDYMNLIQCETLEGIGFANHVILIQRRIQESLVGGDE